MLLPRGRARVQYFITWLPLWVLQGTLATHDEIPAATAAAAPPGSAALSGVATPETSET